MDIQAVKILEVIEKLEVRINAYWNFYTIVVIAAVGWLMSSKAPFSFSQSVVLTVAVTFFFTVNFLIMRAATRRVVAFEAELNSISEKDEFASTALAEELRNPSMPGRLVVSYFLHVVVDVSVIFAIWSKLA